MKLGIDKIKEIIESGAVIGNAIGDILEDKKVSLGDAGDFIKIATEVPKIVKNKDEFIAQMKDLDEAERVELQTFCKDKFDIPDDEAEQFIEDCYDWVCDGVSWAIRGVKLFKSGKEIF